MAKRANGEGSYIHIRPVDCKVCPDRTGCNKIGNLLDKCSKRDRQDRWCYQYTVTQPDGSKRIKQMYARSKKELKDRVERLQTETGQDFKLSATLGNWLDVWQDRYLKDTVRNSTASFYRNMLKYIPESFRQMKIYKVKPVMLQMLFSDLLDHGGKNGAALSVKTVCSVRQVLGTAMEAAVDNGFLTRNPVKQTKPPVDEEQRELVVLDEEEVRRLLKVAETGEYYIDYKHVTEDEGSQYLVKCFEMAVRLTLETGLRWGECFGLTWKDVNFDQETVYIHNNLQDGKLKRTKTKYSTRTIKVDVYTMQRLREWKKYQHKYARMKGDLFQETMGLLFTQTNGKPVRYDNFRIRYFDRMCQKAFLPEKCTFHALRRTHATILLRKNVSARVISNRLGHSKVEFSMKAYTPQKLPDLDQKAAEVMGNVLTKAVEPVKVDVVPATDEDDKKE